MTDHDSALRDTYKLPTPRRRPIRPPALRKFPVYPRGPKLYDSRNDNHIGGPGEPPPGFLSPTNSRTEWLVYWALARILKWPKNPRQGPYTGYPGLWEYQSPFEGGRAARGGQVIDFVVLANGTGSVDVAIRIQTERYHVFTSSEKRAVDQLLLIRQGRYQRVEDVYDQDIVGDTTGQAAIVQTKRAIWGSTTSPLRSGTARRIRSNGK